MAMKRTPRPRDPVQLGKLMVDIMTGQIEDKAESAMPSAASEMGRKGAAARARKLTAAQRAEIARVAAEARWKKS
jgi:hypothetical protein